MRRTPCPTTPVRASLNLPRAIDGSGAVPRAGPHAARLTHKAAGVRTLAQASASASDPVSIAKGPQPSPDREGDQRHQDQAPVTAIEQLDENDGAEGDNDDGVNRHAWTDIVFHGRIIDRPPGSR